MKINTAKSWMPFPTATVTKDQYLEIEDRNMLRSVENVRDSRLAFSHLRFKLHLLLRYLGSPHLYSPELAQIIHDRIPHGSLFMCIRSLVLYESIPRSISSCHGAEAMVRASGKRLDDPAQSD